MSMLNYDLPKHIQEELTLKKTIQFLKNGIKIKQKKKTKQTHLFTSV